MPIWDRWIDSSLQRLGYVKADPARVPIGTVFESEAPRRPELDFDQWTNEQKERLALTLSWVFSDINLISGKVAQADLGVYEYQNESLTAIVDHPFEQLMQRPFRFWPKAFTLRYTVAWWLLRGEAYWWKLFDGAGDLAGFLPVPSARMRPIPDSQAYIGGFAYKPRHGKPAIRIPAEQVVFFRFPNPFDFHRGLSPRTGYQLPMETDIAAQKWNRDTFTKEATLRTLIGLPAELDPKVYRQAKEEILRELTELGRRFMVARSGQVSAEVLGQNHKDLEFLAGREFSREEIDRVFGVPAGYWAKEATRANSEAAKATLIEDTVWPLLVLMHDAITEQVIIPHYGQGMRARFEDIRPRDRKLLVQERRQNWQVMTVDEARGDLGMEPLADEVMGKTLVPLVTKGGPGQALTPGMEGKARGTLTPTHLDVARGRLSQGERERLEDLRRWRSVARRLEGEGKSAAGYAFVSEWIPEGLAAGIRSAIERMGADGAFRFVKAAPDGRDAVERALLRAIKGILATHLDGFAEAIEAGRALDYAALEADLRKTLEPELEGIATEVALREAMGVGVQFDPAVVNAAAADWARDYTYELITGLTETTRGVVSRAVRQFVEMPGMTREQLEAAVAPAFGDYRASMIAVTEVTRAYSAATRMYANLLEMSAGIQMVGVWHTRVDELVCPICGPLDGQPEDVWRDEFPDGPPAHVGCRCWTVLEYRGK